MSKQVYLAHCTDPNGLVYNLERTDVIRQPDDGHVIVNAEEDGVRKLMEMELGLDASFDLEQAFDLLIEQLRVNALDAFAQLRDAFKTAHRSADMLDGMEDDEFTVSEYVANQGAIVAEVFNDIGSAAQLNLIKAMKLAREEAD